MKALIFALFLLSAPAFADANCREESLIHFFSDGQEVASELIGSGDPCDEFGGNRVYTPKAGVYLYVNFNIAGNINLDQIDLILSRAKHPERAKIQLAVVTSDWMKRVQGEDRDAVLSLGRDTLFISEAALDPERFAALMRDFYNLD